MEEHNNITYIPPPSKTGEQVATSPLEVKSQDTKHNHSLKHNLETPFSPEKTTMAPVDREVENIYSPERTSRTSTDREFEKVYSPERAVRAPANRDIGLARIESDKRMSMIKAWEDSKKAKADNKAQKKMMLILSWENTKGASIEAKLRKRQELLEKKKAANAEKLNNQIASVHKEVELKRAAIEASRGKAIVEVEEMAAKYRAIGTVPHKENWCCGRSY